MKNTFNYYNGETFIKSSTRDTYKWACIIRKNDGSVKVIQISSTRNGATKEMTNQKNISLNNIRFFEDCIKNGKQPYSWLDNEKALESEKKVYEMYSKAEIVEIEIR